MLVLAVRMRCMGKNEGLHLHGLSDCERIARFVQAWLRLDGDGGKGTTVLVLVV